MLGVNFEVFGGRRLQSSFFIFIQNILPLSAFPSILDDFNILFQAYFSRSKTFLKVTVQGFSPSPGVASFLGLRLFSIVRMEKRVFFDNLH